jgi:hypothetical protein
LSCLDLSSGALIKKKYIRIDAINFDFFGRLINFRSVHKRKKKK